MSTLERRRDEIRSQAANQGVTIEQLPSGLLHLRGEGVDLRVRDLADVHPADLKPGRW